MVSARARSPSSTRSAPRPATTGLASPPPIRTGATKRRSSSISPASQEGAGERRAALEQEAGDAAAAELGEGAGGQRPGGDAPRRRPRAGPRRVPPGRPGRSRRRAAPPGSTRRASSRAGAGRVESKTTRAGWRAAGGSRSRAVSRASSASAVPIPTATASDSARQRCTRRAAALAGDPLRVARAGRDLAVERARHLQRDERQARAGVLAEGLVEEAGGGRLGALGELDLAAVVAQHPGAAAARLLARVLGGDHDALDRGREDRLGARRRPAVVGAGLERHEHRRPLEIGPARARVGDRGDLGVRAAELGVPALADDLAAARDHGADERVRADAAPAALGQLEGAAKVSSIVLSLGFGSCHSP